MASLLCLILDHPQQRDEITEGWDGNRQSLFQDSQDSQDRSKALRYRWGRVVRFEADLKAESEGLSGGWYKLIEENKHGSGKCNKNEDICQDKGDGKEIKMSH